MDLFIPVCPIRFYYVFVLFFFSFFCFLSFFSPFFCAALFLYVCIGPVHVRVQADSHRTAVDLYTLRFI